MHTRSVLLLCFLSPVVCAFAGDDITWLHRFDGKALPTAQGWSPVGRAAAMSRVVDGALQILDDSVEEDGAFRVNWTPDPSREIVVEARVRFESMAAEGSRLRVGFEEGAPVSLLVGDGRRQEGFLLYPDRVASFLDRVYPMDTRSSFHTYRLAIRENDMSVFVDGQLRIRGEGAFWKEAVPDRVRRVRVEFAQIQGRIPLVFRPDRPAEAGRATRKTQAAHYGRPALGHPTAEPGAASNAPYLDDVGKGMLLMTVAQGGDVIYLPYGILKSVDLGKTWTPIDGLQVKTFAPRKAVRLPGGDILGVSRWTVKYDDTHDYFVGMSYRFDPRAETYRMFESTIRIPDDMGHIGFDRDIFDLGNGEIVASVYGSTAKSANRYRNILLKSTDGGETWTHYSTVGENPEPAYAWLSKKEVTSVTRTQPRRPMVQKWSKDGGKTWGPATTLEVGSADPGLLLMSKGVLACCYGRPGSNLMFSLDGGKTWLHHQVISGEHGFNYTAIREVQPGRLQPLPTRPRKIQFPSSRSTTTTKPPHDDRQNSPLLAWEV